MTWLVFAVSGLLILAGAVSLVSGAPIIQLERGWAEVISGAVAMSGGGITFALGVVLLRLQALQGALGTVNVAPPVTVMPEPPAVEPDEVVEPPMPAPVEALFETEEPTRVRAPAALPVAVAPVPEPEPAPETRHGLWKRVRRPASDPVPSEPSEPVFEPPSLLRATAPEIEAAAASADNDKAPAVRPMSWADPEQEREPEGDALAPPPFEPPAIIERPAPVEPPRKAAITPSWMNRSVFRTTTIPEPPVEEPRLEPQGLHPEEPLLAESPANAEEPPPADEPPSLFRSTLAPAVEPPAEIHDETLQPPEAAEEPTVVGRYQAGVASYVMYSDGTIRVETEHGDVHHFGSMEELKAFVAQQESTVS